MARIRYTAVSWIAVVAACSIAAVALVTTGHRHKGDVKAPEPILEKADDLSWKNDWMGAAPLYREAELVFEKQHRPSNALYARVSQMIPRAEYEPLPELLLTLQKDLLLPEAQDPETLLRILTIKGMIETNYDASIAHNTWQQVQNLATRRRHYLLAMRAMGEQGIAAFFLGDFANSKKLVLRAWVAAKYLHDPAAHVRYASVYGAGLVELQRYNEAINVLDEAINAATKSSGVAYPTIAITSKIDALRGLHRYTDALTLADAVTRRLPTSNLDAHLYQIMTSRGQIFDAMGRWDQAGIQFNQALHYARELNSWRGITLTGGLLAEAYEHENDLGAALMAINEAIEANAHLPQELYYTPKNLAVKADILGKLGHRDESQALYEKSLTLIDLLLATVPTPNVEREVLTQLRDVYSGYFESLCRHNNLPGAFRIIERARGRIEAQALEHHPLVLPHEPTLAEIRITQLNLDLIRTDSPSIRARVSKALYEAELQLDDPVLANQAARSPLSIRAVQSHMGADELILEYVLADPQSHVLAITSKHISKYDLPSRNQIESQVAVYRKAIQNRTQDLKTSQLLFTELLGPVDQYSSKRRVIIIPDEGLHLLPFSALVDGNLYAVTNHTFSVSPSATVMCLLRDRESATYSDPRQYVGVAAWTNDEEIPHKLTGITLPPAPAFPDLILPESKVEVETIARNFPSSATLLLGPDATETRFKGLPLNEYRILHLALHGYADLEYPDRSALVFASEQNTSAGPAANDGLLEVREIRNLRLKASLVTLSACNTGVGPVGEVDVDNLGNAFIEAGAESVITALWEVQDRTTKQLMTSFYSNLARRQTKADALRNAQLDMLRSGLPPYFWAGFELTGDPSKEL